MSSLSFDNLADDFALLWQQTQEESAQNKRQAFRRVIMTQLPEFYGADRFTSEAFGNPSKEDVDAFTDKRIDAAFERFPEIRFRYLDKVRAFDQMLQRSVATFTSHFPDFQPSIKIYLLHSLGEMDGGTRQLHGETVLIFGADGMVEFHDFVDERAFFVHELFHTYHNQRFSQCEQLWCDAWKEGLAVYVSEALTPGASMQELLLDVPVGMPAAVNERLVLSLNHLKSVSDSKDQNVYSALFQTSQDDTGLPPRRGYYLGYLLVQEAASTMPLDQLAKLSPDEAKVLFRSSLETLLRRAAPLSCVIV